MSEAVRIADIIIGERFREDMGDLQGLADSIAAQGLLQAIGITEENVLVFGERRLRACRELLGWTEIPARVVNVTSILEGERDENEVRKDFAPSERVAIAEALRTYTERGRPEKSDHGPIIPVTTDEAAKRAGLDNERTFRRARAVVDSGTPELVRAMDEGKASIRAAADIATLPQQQQREIVARGESEILNAAKEIRLEKALARLPEDERAAARALVEQPGIPTGKATEMVANLAVKPTEERVRIYSLSGSQREQERDLALTEASNLPPMPHPAVQSLNLAMQYLRDAHKRAEGSVKDTLAEMIRLGRQAVDQAKHAA